MQEMITGILYFVTLLILVNDKRWIFSNAKPTEGSQMECGEGQSYYSESDECIPCSDHCKTNEDACRRHGCRAPPKVQVRSRKTNVTENEHVRLTCATSGGKPEDIKQYTWLWRKNNLTQDQVIQDTKTKNSMQNGSLFEIKRISYNMSGTYTCRAWNMNGMGQGSIDLYVHVAPEISTNCVSRADNIVSIRWEKVIGHYTAIKVEYCQAGTEDCVHYIVPNPNDTVATFFVDRDKAYYYHIIIEDGDDVFYRSNCLVATDCDTKPAAAKMTIIGVSRTDNKVTIRWQQAIGHVTSIKVKYCQIGTVTEYCEYYIAPSPEDTSASWFVDPDKTYYYYMVIEDGGDVVFTSNPLVVDESDAKTDMFAVKVGGSVTGAVILTATGVILAVALWKHRRSRQEMNNRLENYTNDDDATRTALAAIKNSSKPTYVNIGTASKTPSSSHHLGRTFKKYPAKSSVNILFIPANRVPVGDVPTSSDDDVDIDQYDYTDTMWLRDTPGSRLSPVDASQATWKHDVSAQIHDPAHLAHQSDPASTGFSYQDIQGGKRNVPSSKQRESVPKSAANDVNNIVAQRRHHQSPSDSGLGQATWQDASFQDLVPDLQAEQDDTSDASSYEHKRESGENVSHDSSYDDVRIVREGQPTQNAAARCINQATWQHNAVGQCPIPPRQANHKVPDDLSLYKGMHEVTQYVLCEKERGHKRRYSDGALYDVNITHVQPTGPELSGLSRACVAQELTPRRANNDVVNGELSRYEQLNPVEDKHEYLDFKELSPK